MTGKRVPTWLSGALMLGGFVALAWLERRRPLRRATEPKMRREARNLAVAGVGAVVVAALETPLVLWLTKMVERNGWGLLKWWRLPWWIEIPVGVLLIDYSMYWWHLANHRVPLLWRMHLPHHADLDLDASTALRFHFGELVASLPVRAAQVMVIGAGPLAFSLWQTLFGLSILFHHSTLELPLAAERRLLWMVVTPRMHGIHHSIVRREAESNFSSGLSLWDRLHRTFRVNVPQAEVTIGVPAYRQPADVTLPKVLAMPFVKLPPVWQLPGAGEPVRGTLPQPAAALEA